MSRALADAIIKQREKKKKRNGVNDARNSPNHSLIQANIILNQNILMLKH